MVGGGGEEGVGVGSSEEVFDFVCGGVSTVGRVSTGPVLFVWKGGWGMGVVVLGGVGRRVEGIGKGEGVTVEE